MNLSHEYVCGKYLKFNEIRIKFKTILIPTWWEIIWEKSCFHHFRKILFDCRFFIVRIFRGEHSTWYSSQFFDYNIKCYGTQLFIYEIKPHYTLRYKFTKPFVFMIFAYKFMFLFCYTQRNNKSTLCSIHRRWTRFLFKWITKILSMNAWRIFLLGAVFCSLSVVFINHYISIKNSNSD